MEIFTRAEYPTAVQGTLRGNTSPVCPCSRHFMYQQTIPYSRIQIFPLFCHCHGTVGLLWKYFLRLPRHPPASLHQTPHVHRNFLWRAHLHALLFFLCLPPQKNVDEILTVYFYPSLRFFTVRHPATPYSNIPSFLPMRSGPFPTGILSNTTASCFLYTPSIVPEQFYWAVQCSFRLCQVQFAISFLKKAANPSCCVKQNLLLKFY